LSRYNTRRSANFVTHWIRAYEETHARTDEAGKDAGPFRLGALFEEPGGGTPDPARIREIADRLVRDAAAAYTAHPPYPEVTISHGEGRFASLLAGEGFGDAARFSYFPARGRAGKPAVVIIHHWNAEPKNYNIFGKLFSMLGITTVVMTLPHHGSRGDGSAMANRFLNANVSDTVRSVRLAVLDVQVAVHWLKASGAGDVGVLGISLGSCVAALAAAFNPQIRAAVLFLSAGDFASVVWTGRATRHIRKAMEGHISLKTLQSLWAVISPDCFVDRFAEAGTKFLLLWARHDQVVLPGLTLEFLDRLKQARADVVSAGLPCGHYSFGEPPFSIFALVRGFLFLRRRLRASDG